MTNIHLSQILALMAIFCCALYANAEVTDGEFERNTTKKGGLKYRTVFPEEYDPQQKYPLLIFLHGAGERGDNLDQVQIHGPFKKVAEEKLPVIIVAPQTPRDEWWEAESLSALTDHLLETLPVDKSRVYLTGLSMGGQGTWLLAMQRPELFAAIAPICGRGKPSKAEVLRDMPVWIFHGGQDNVVPLGEATSMANALYSVGNDARLTIYPDAGHDSWTETYNNPQFYEWLLSHTKKPKTTKEGASR